MTVLDQGRLASTPLARGYKECRPLRQQRTLKQGERQQYRDALTDGIQRHIDNQ